MKSENIVNEPQKNIAQVPQTLCAATVAYTFGCTKRTATNALESLAAAEIESLVKNLQTCEQKAEEIIEHTTGGERTRKAALEIRIAAVAHDL